MKEYFNLHNWTIPSSNSEKFWLLFSVLGVVAGLYLSGLHLFSPPEPSGVTTWGVIKAILLIILIIGLLFRIIKPRADFLEIIALILICLGLLCGRVWDIYSSNIIGGLGGMLFVLGFAINFLVLVNKSTNKEIG